jgi:hypothetical protein
MRRVAPVPPKAGPGEGVWGNREVSQLPGERATGFGSALRGKLPFDMLRKVLWTAVNAAAIVGARRAASRLWRIATGEEPPVKR